MTPTRIALLACLVLGLAACITIGNPNKPIATIIVPATQPAAEKTLIVVLPGFGNDAESLEKHKVGEIVHAHWPQADVALTSATMAYYSRRNIITRLDEDVIDPARKQGYKNIWLAGASVGGMGALLYEYAHPGAMSGIVLLAPWLGSHDIQDEIRKAGGVRGWDPGPKPATVDNDNFEHELWRVVKRWSDDPDLANRVWMICGNEDRMLPGNRLLAPAIPASHYLEIPGSHNWDTFQVAIDKIIEQIRRPAQG